MRVPPVEMIDEGSQGWSHVVAFGGDEVAPGAQDGDALVGLAPVIVRELTYGVDEEAAGARIVSCFASGRVNEMSGKSGLANARSADPGVTGYIPIAAHTYHDEIAPRSSLPGSLTGVSE